MMFSGTQHLLRQISGLQVHGATDEVGTGGSIDRSEFVQRFRLYSENMRGTIKSIAKKYSSNQTTKRVSDDIANFSSTGELELAANISIIAKEHGIKIEQATINTILEKCVEANNMTLAQLIIKTFPEMKLVSNTIRHYISSKTPDKAIEDIIAAYRIEAVPGILVNDMLTLVANNYKKLAIQIAMAALKKGIDLRPKVIEKLAIETEEQHPLPTVELVILALYRNFTLSERFLSKVVKLTTEEEDVRAQLIKAIESYRRRSKIQVKTPAKLPENKSF